MHNALAHAEKAVRYWYLVATLKPAVMCGPAGFSVPSTYLERLLSRAIKRKNLRLVNYSIFYFNRACSSKGLATYMHLSQGKYFLLGLTTHYCEY